MNPEVLIVEDDVRLARLVARQLDRAGYAVRLADSAEAALLELERAEPTLLLVDLLLPGMGGQVLLDRLGEGSRRRPRIIAMSGVYKTGSDAARSARKLSDAFLDKPFTSDALLASVRLLVGPARPARGQPRLELRDMSAIEVIWNAGEREFSGALCFEREGCRKELLFVDGTVRAIRSSLSRERLGDRLFAIGRISRSGYEESSRAAKNALALQGEVLVELGELTAADLEREVAEQAHAKLMELCSWTTGQSWERPDVRALPTSTPFVECDLEAVVFQGARQLSPQTVAYLLAPYRDHAVAVEAGSSATSTQEGSLVRLFAQLAPGSRIGDLPEDELPTLFAAWKTDRIEFVSEGAASRGRGQPGLVELDLAQRVARQASQDLFGALGVTPATNIHEIERAHELLAQRWAADRFAEEPRRVRELAGSLRARVDEAHAVLSDDVKREAYTRQLADRFQVGKPQAEAAPMTQLACAEGDLRRAEELIGRCEYEAAATALESVLALEPNDAEARALLGWAVFASHPGDETATARALEQLSKALDLDARSPSAPYYLGCIYRHLGRAGRARRMLALALERDPKHLDAERELRSLNRRGS